MLSEIPEGDVNKIICLEKILSINVQKVFWNTVIGKCLKSDYQTEIRKLFGT